MGARRNSQPTPPYNIDWVARRVKYTGKFFGFENNLKLWKELGVSAYFINNSGAWIIYGSRFLQPQEVACEAVGNYREQAAMKLMGEDWPARRVKYTDKFFALKRVFCFGKNLVCRYIL